METFLDSFGREFYDFFYAYADGFFFDVGDESGLLRHNRVDPISGNDHFGIHFIFAGNDSDDFTVLLNKIVHFNAADQHGSHFFGLSCQPLVKTARRTV
jgi:hypothetical protein